MAAQARRERDDCSSPYERSAIYELDEAVWIYHFGDLRVLKVKEERVLSLYASDQVGEVSLGVDVSGILAGHVYFAGP